MTDSLKMRVVSRWTDQEIKLNDPPPDDLIEYLPWGTRTLKMALEGDVNGRVRVQPERRDDSADLIAGCAQGPGGEAIQVSWGGGWEQGVEVDCKRGKTAYAFFNVTHLGPDAADAYTLNLIARDDKGDKLTELAVSLMRPEELPASILVPHWQAGTVGGDQVMDLRPSDHGPAGVPFYVSRWWPECWLQYASPGKVGSPPLIELECQSNVGEGYSQVKVSARKDGVASPVELATIGGDLQFPTCELRHIGASLFYMAGHWALRIWFFWLDKGVPQKLAAADRSEDEQKILDEWATAQEIPDSERVDLVFDNDLKLRFLCTDLHWHELWAPYERSGPVRISIAGRRRRDVVIRGQEGLSVVFAARARRYIPRPEGEFDPSLEVMEQLRDPKRMAKAAGSILHKHTPYFHDSPFEADLTSNDVREG